MVCWVCGRVTWPTLPRSVPRQSQRSPTLTTLYPVVCARVRQVAPYAGAMFWAYEAARRQFLYVNGYTTSRWTDMPKPNVDQNLSLAELRRKTSSTGS
jgi:hypothetical protein